MILPNMLDVYKRQVIYNSLAKCYGDTIEEIEALTGKKYTTIYVVGGGANAGYLNELTAKYTGKKVSAGPSEATAIGNIVVQMLHDGVFKDLPEDVYKRQVHQYNPIEHIKTRIKTPDSIVKKLKRYGHETSIENMVRYVNDIAGVRLICSFTSDIYRLAEMIGNQSDLKVLSIKDYIKNPKESGYKSYHMLVSVPIFLSDLSLIHI